MDDPTISAAAPRRNGSPPAKSEVVETKKAIHDARLKSASLPSYHVMTVNMKGNSLLKGKGIVNDQRMLFSKIEENYPASVIFCQEIPGCFKEKVVDVNGKDVYDFVVKEKEAAVMWRKEDFDGERVDTIRDRSIRQIINQLREKRPDVDTSELSLRTAMVKLEMRDETSKYPPFLAVSWHGPWKVSSTFPREKKPRKQRKVFNGLICFLLRVCEEKKISSVIIGGDFNLNTLEDLEDTDLKVANVTLPHYELSQRSKEEQELSDRYVPYKDNFAYFTIPDPNNPRSLLGSIRVRNVRPFEFVGAKDPGSDLTKEDQQEVDSEKGPDRERKNLLDHDPIIGVLELRTVKQAEMQVHKGQEETESVVNNPAKMQVHKGQEETESLPRSFEQLSIGSNPAESHRLQGNTSCWVYHVCQSNIDGRNSSSACSIISMAIAHRFLTADIQPPSEGASSSDWGDLLISCMREGNKLKDSTDHPHQLLTAEEAAKLYCGRESSIPIMKVMKTDNPVKLEDEHVPSTIKHHFESLTQTASDSGSPCAALFIYDNKTISFLISPNGSIVVTDSHSHPSHNPHGAAIMFAESFTPDFVLSLKEIANVSDSTIGSISRVILNDH